MTVVRELLSSKKFVAVLISLAVWLGGYAGLELDPLTLAPIFGTIIAYILGQGLADQGKSAAKIQAESASKKDVP